jgi:hypothetical protein
MTKAEKLMQAGELSIALNVNSSDGSHHAGYVAEFKPGYLNVLHIKDIGYDDDKEDPIGNFIAISHESAIELAQFLKELFLDELPEE